MDLEVEVVRRRDRVARISDEAEDIPGVDPRTVDGEGRVRGEMRVVELVARRSSSQSRFPPSVFHPTEKTTPFATASTGEPSVAKRSSP